MIVVVSLLCSGYSWYEEQMALQVALGVLLMLTIVTISGSVQASLPPVPYVKVASRNTVKFMERMMYSYTIRQAGKF